MIFAAVDEMYEIAGLRFNGKNREVVGYGENLGKKSLISFGKILISF